MISSVSVLLLVLVLLVVGLLIISVDRYDWVAFCPWGLTGSHRNNAILSHMAWTAADVY